MKTVIVWNGIEYNSVEHCMIDYKQDSVLVNSTITGCYNSDVYKADYSIELDKNWRPSYVFIQLNLNGEEHTIKAEYIHNKWLINGQLRYEFADVDYIDISLTPFTNTFPVNRLHLKTDEQQTIEVLYFDLLDSKIKLMKQQYTRLSNEHYLYENFDKSFAAEIEVDEKGLVTQYPGLFKMACIKHL